MLGRSYLYILAAAALPSCVLYDGGLIDEATGVGTTGSSSGGNGMSPLTTGGTGGLTMTGGSGGNVTNPTGGTSETGGMGGQPSGGTGGMTAGSFVLVDDLEQSATYFNDPFFGGWDRYGQTSDGMCSVAKWETGGVTGMVVAREDDPSNHAFAVKATDLDCWGIGVYLTLQQAGSVTSTDISSYGKLAFSVRGVGVETVLRVGIEDESTHQGTCTDFCDQHATAVGVPPINDEWQDFEIALAAFMPAATNTFDATTAYAIHFTMDPGSEVVDFLLDDIRFIE